MQVWTKFTLVTLNANSVFMSSFSFMSFSLNNINGGRHFDFLIKLLHFNGKNVSLSRWQFPAIERLVFTEI